MDKLKIKHNHKLTDILKVCIFAIVMMAPLLSIATRCLYVICNRNAKDSYSQQQVVQSVEMNSNTTSLYENGNTIIVNIVDDKTYGTASGQFGYSEISLDVNQLLNTENIEYKAFSFYTASATWMYFWDVNGVSHRLDNYKNLITTYTYVIDKNNGTSTQIYNYVDASILIYGSDKLDNVFDYSIQQIAEGPTFNWTTNTGIYTTINAMFTGLDMPSNNALAIMLTYWMICMLIYLVIDIIVALITKMTHLFNE